MVNLNNAKVIANITRLKYKDFSRNRSKISERTAVPVFRKYNFPIFSLNIIF